MATNSQLPEDFQLLTSLSTISSTPEEEDQLNLSLRGLLSFAEIMQAHADLVINATLRFYHGNQCRAALALGMHRNTLSRRIDGMAERGALKASLRHCDYKKSTQAVGGKGSEGERRSA